MWWMVPVQIDKEEDLQLLNANFCELNQIIPPVYLTSWFADIDWILKTLPLFFLIFPQMYLLDLITSLVRID